MEDWVERGLPAYHGPVRLQGQGIIDFGVEVPLGALLFTVIYSSQRVIPPSPSPSPRSQERLAGRPFTYTSHYLYDAPPPGSFSHSPASLLLYPEDILSEARREETQLPAITNDSRRPTRPPPGWTTAIQDRGPRHSGVKPVVFKKQGKMTKEWLKYRTTILGLYKDQSKTLDEVRRIMKEEYGFEAS